MKVLFVVAAALLASGCSLFPQYEALKAVAHQGVETAIQDRKNLNDLKQDVLLALPCDVSLGAVMRLPNERQRAILIELCGGPAADSQMTVDDLAAMMKVIQR